MAPNPITVFGTELMAGFIIGLILDALGGFLTLGLVASGRDSDDDHRRAAWEHKNQTCWRCLRALPKPDQGL